MKLLKPSATMEEIGKLNNLEAIINFTLPITGDILYAKLLNNITDELMSKNSKFFNFTLNAFVRYVPFIIGVSYLIR